MEKKQTTREVIVTTAGDMIELWQELKEVAEDSSRSDVELIGTLVMVQEKIGQRMQQALLVVEAAE